MHPLGVVPGGGQQRGRGFSADAAGAEQCRVGLLAQRQQLGVEFVDLRGERLMAASQCPQRSFGRAGGGSAAGADAPPGTDLDHLWRVESSQPVSEVLRAVTATALIWLPATVRA